MKPAENIERLLKSMNVTPSPDRDRQMVESIMEAQAPIQKQTPAQYLPGVWRIIMKSRITKLAVAAVILIALFIVIQPPNILPRAYAIQDTMEANHSIRWIRVKKLIGVGENMRTSEFWLACDTYGNPEFFRFQTDACSCSLGEVTIVSYGSEADIWLPKFNCCYTIQSSAYYVALLLMEFDVTEIDPKMLFEDLDKQKASGDVFLNIHEPVQKSKPIVITVTYPDDSLSADYKKLLYVDQATKLLTKLELYRTLANQEDAHIHTAEFFNYNQPIDLSMFSLEEELPEDVLRVDQTDAEIGLIQGTMTDKEVAEELTWQFFKASAEKDYKKMGLLYCGLPEFIVEEAIDLTALKGLNITFVGPARPATAPGSNAMISTCKGKIEGENGQIYNLHAEVHVLPITEQPRRWTMAGISGNALPDHEPITLPYDEADLSFDYNLPEDTMGADQTEAEIGLVQGDMTDDEVAETLTRQLFEAVAARDYSKAGLLFLAPPKTLIIPPHIFELLHGLELQSIRPARPAETAPGSKALISFYYGKSVYNGQVFNLEVDVYVRPMTDPPHRWGIYRVTGSSLPDTSPLMTSFDEVDLSDVTYDGLVPGDFMRNWLVLGPMPNQVPPQIDSASEQGRKIAFETDALDVVHFSPRVTIGSQDYKWTLVESTYDTIDLNRLETNEGKYKTAYVWAQVDMPKEKNVTLGLGSADAVKVWLNGDLVHENYVTRVTLFDNDQVPVSFKEGINDLVLKVQKINGQWGFCCRVLEE